MSSSVSCLTTHYCHLSEENLRLQEQVLRLRADVGRERVENASLAEGLAQAETRVGVLSFVLGRFRYQRSYSFCNQSVV